MEKTLPTQELPQAATAPRRSKRAFAPVLLFLAATAYYFSPSGLLPTVKHSGHHGKHHAVAQCAQPTPLVPASTPKLLAAYESLSSKTFRDASILRLSGAVQVRTESFDDLGPIDEDKRWEAMYPFADYLAATFPLVHSHLKLEKVNTHGLVYTWAGSNSSLKPSILMAHQDVVPVPDATVSAWTHPPFAGFYDGKYIWGRGASDCKNQLIAIMETVETLIAADFTPKRTLVLPFGFDEEISGREGAGSIAPFLHERYGDNGIAAIVDEGATFEKAWGATFAKPGVGEKGYTDVSVIVRMPGGHSSIPSDHTSIGVAAEIIQAVEAEQYPTFLADNNPYLGQLYCGTEHAPNFPKKLSQLLATHVSAPVCPAMRTKHKDALALEAAKAGPGTKYLMQTSQAVDVIHGGVKTNALPERTEITINHRINVGSTPQEAWYKISKIAEKIAKKHNLTLQAFTPAKEIPNSITLRASKTTLPVAPISPTLTNITSPYSILAATTRALYGEDTIVTPGIMTGNTDTRYYWALTKHIFRFGPGYDAELDNGLGNIHTVDEKVSVTNHVNAVKWFWLFVGNMDDAELE
ncbi:hypothetical protein B0A48_14306 [Cryoendolithus antarcticus]|uniref:Peptidase M20 dimerisation domain-containing protein n=1 Tax=Cryoendolithus antarcticus TaxID=1507870 RepID=A0A1V8SJS8_9PEZI|nr:hypothetical protein B0A48_14306 [Cryoendolithus antarcticus]